MSLSWFSLSWFSLSWLCVNNRSSYCGYVFGEGRERYTRWFHLFLLLLLFDRFFYSFMFLSSLVLSSALFWLIFAFVLFGYWLVLSFVLSSFCVVLWFSCLRFSCKRTCPMEIDESLNLPSPRYIGWRSFGKATNVWRYLKVDLLASARPWPNIKDQRPRPWLRPRPRPRPRPWPR